MMAPRNDGSDNFKRSKNREDSSDLDENLTELIATAQAIFKKSFRKKFTKKFFLAEKFAVLIAELPAAEGGSHLFLEPSFQRRR